MSNNRRIELMSPDEHRRIQAMKDKAMRAWKPGVTPAVKKFVALKKAAHLEARDRKRAVMVANGQMKGGFPKD